MPQNSKTSLSVADFKARMMDGIPIKDSQIEGDTDLSGCTISAPVSVPNSIFVNRVNFGGCRFERDLILQGCHFKCMLNMAGARIEGSVILDTTVVGEPVALPRAGQNIIASIMGTLHAGRIRMRTTRHEPRHERLRKLRLRIRRRTSEQRWARRGRDLQQTQQESAASKLVDFTNIRIAGKLSLNNVHVHGSLFCEQSDIEDEICLDGATILGDLRLRRTSMGELLTDANTRGSKATEREPAKSSRIYGKLDMTSSKVMADVRLIGVTIGGELGAQSAEVGGNFICRSTAGFRGRLEGGAWLRGLRVRNTMDLSEVRIYGDLNMTDAEVEGYVSCSGYGRGYFHVAGNLVCESVRVGGMYDISGARIDGHVNLKYGAIGSLECGLSKKSGMVRTCQIGGSGLLFGIQVKNDVSFHATQIGGALIIKVHLSVKRFSFA